MHDRCFVMHCITWDMSQRNTCMLLFLFRGCNGFVIFSLVMIWWKTRHQWSVIQTQYSQTTTAAFASRWRWRNISTRSSLEREGAYNCILDHDQRCYQCTEKLSEYDQWDFFSFLQSRRPTQRAGGIHWWRDHVSGELRWRHCRSTSESYTIGKSDSVDVHSERRGTVSCVL